MEAKKCSDCGEKFQPESFRVMVNDLGPFLSLKMCAKCCIKKGVKVIES